MKKKKKKIQIMQTKCIRFCFKLEKKRHMSEEEFRMIDWLRSSKRVEQCINSITSNFVNNTCPYYLNEIFEFAPHYRIITFLNLKLLFARQTWDKKKFFYNISVRFVVTQPLLKFFIHIYLQ